MEPCVFGEANNETVAQMLAMSTLGISKEAAAKIASFKTTKSADWNSENGYYKFDLTATFKDTYRWDQKQIADSILNFHGKNFAIDITNDGKTLTLKNLWSNVPDNYYANQHLVNWTGWKATANCLTSGGVSQICNMLFHLGCYNVPFAIIDKSQRPDMLREACQLLGISSYEGVKRIRLTINGTTPSCSAYLGAPEAFKLPFNNYQKLDVSVSLEPGWCFTEQTYTES